MHSIQSVCQSFSTKKPTLAGNARYDRIYPFWQNHLFLSGRDPESRDRATSFAEMSFVLRHTSRYVIPRPCSPPPPRVAARAAFLKPV